MSKEKSEKWGIKYPNYQAYLLKHSLQKNALHAVIFYLLMIFFFYENLLQMKAILSTILYFFILLIIDYFLIYKPNKKIHESNS